MELLGNVVSLIFGIIGIPLIMIIFGGVFGKNAPKEINSVYGYRTAMSIKNRDTWEFAHKFYGRVSLICGTVLLVASVVLLVLFLRRGAGFGKAVLITAGVQFVVLLLSTFSTEIALKIKFDKDGNRK